MNKCTLAKILTYAGTLPFLVMAVFALLQLQFAQLDYRQIILTYGAVIVSFIAGIHWGVYLFKTVSINLFVHSNVVALLAWIAVITDISFSELILVACFIYLLAIDKRLYNESVFESWYLRMRVVASSIVISALVLHSLV